MNWMEEFEEDTKKVRGNFYGAWRILGKVCYLLFNCFFLKIVGKNAKNLKKKELKLVVVLLTKTKKNVVWWFAFIINCLSIYLIFVKIKKK